MEWVTFDFYDASVLVKLVVDERASETLSSHFESWVCQTYTNALCLAEALGALKAKRNRNEISEDGYFRAAYGLTAHVRGGTIKLDELDLLTPQVFFDAETLAKRHSLDLADALQIETLKHGRLGFFGGESAPVLVTADGKLAAAARAEGLLVWDVLNEPTRPQP